MKKATMFTVYLALFIIVLFGICIAMTFVTEYLQQSGFFGDIKLGIGTSWMDSTPHILTDGTIDVHHEWGARHYYYFIATIILFIISIIRILTWSFNYWNFEL